MSGLVAGPGPPPPLGGTTTGNRVLALDQRVDPRAVRPDGVGLSTAVGGVRAAVAHVERIGPRPAVEHVLPEAAVEDVRPGVAEQHVASGVAAQDVGISGAERVLDSRERVAAAAAGVLGAGDRQVDRHACRVTSVIRRIRAWPAVHAVAVGAGQEEVVAARARERVAALVSHEHVGAGPAGDAVGASARDEEDRRDERGARARAPLGAENVGARAAEAVHRAFGHPAREDVRIGQALELERVGVDPVAAEADPRAVVVGDPEDRAGLILEADEDLDSLVPPCSSPTPGTNRLASRMSTVVPVAPSELNTWIVPTVFTAGVSPSQSICPAAPLTVISPPVPTSRMARSFGSGSFTCRAVVVATNTHDVAAEAVAGSASTGSTASRGAMRA